MTPPTDSSVPPSEDQPLETHPVRAVILESLARAGRFLRRYWLWGAVLLVGALLWKDMQPDVTVEETGPMAPDFALEQMNGEVFRLSEHRGEVVVLNIWATWCDPCHTEVPGFVELQKEFADEGVTFVGLSIDERGFEAVRAFARKYDINYPQLASQTVAWEKYGRSQAVPRTFVIGRQGRIRYRRTGLLLKGRLEIVLDELVSEPTASR
ncbi:peroxiredoxin [Salinibacter ruber]|uniref:peroxiredoxin family protein n=1 Tax=Salinibacter ruber TaxID=146919 RepID=UPI0021691777|nr:TlpA disulfide reductase family protein [Salinibacter ruber]MCS3666304.1 peroxiredoxin [Salinibacter ruber]MCS4194044.1 peroxiredoxin [Salinibacter ruber]